MIQLISCILFIINIKSVVLVPPSNASLNENLNDEMANIKNTMKILSEQWEKWNTLFITSLEPRITSTASTLSSIDSNIHNLQERAHVWDTFQLHVSAWNDQLASLDRKMDILSKGIEKLVIMDNKLNTMLSAEYKLDQIIKMINSFDEFSKMDVKNRINSNCKSTTDSLFEEFTARGILSSLKLVERKLDRMLIVKQNDLSKIKATEENAVKCGLNKQTVVLIDDISSKVDLIFDSLHKKTDNSDYSDDYVDVKDSTISIDGSGDSDIGTGRFEDVVRTRRRGSSGICKTIEQRLKEINSTMVDINDNVLLVRNNSNYYTKDVLKNYLEKTLNYQTQNLNILMNSYFKEEKSFVNSKFEILEKKIDTNFVTAKPTTEKPKVVTTQITESSFSQLHPELMYINDYNKNSCEHLSHNNSAIYIFKNNKGNFANERFFNKKFCISRSNSLWTLIQRRDNYKIQQDFNVSWNDYKFGFGDLEKDFWIGNNFLARWSRTQNLTLRIELEDFNKNTVWAEYDVFKVTSEKDGFKLTIGEYSGNTTDSFSSHNGALFSTYDRKNDNAPDCCPCAVSYGGGWWFTKCFESNLNGAYHRNPLENAYFRGIIWEHWLGNYSLKKSLMMVKSKGLTQQNNITHIEDP